MKKIAILGSTGSVGANALRLIASHENRFKVVGLAAHSNTDLLFKQASRFSPKLIAIGNTARREGLRRRPSGVKRVLSGPEGVCEVAAMKEADIVLLAISGIAGIMPLVSAIKAGKRVALANKESVVSAGRIIMDMAKTCRATIIPVDSEHNSIFQCINNQDKRSIKKIYLMGTGGPLKNVPGKMFDRLESSRILAHPVWRMGRKISIDSATMMNKGLEAIEASNLFDIDISKIEILIHPEAVIHSMVEFRDGNVMANLFYPDMKMPVFYALSYPERQDSGLRRIDFRKIKNISFKQPDYKRFPALRLCYGAAEKGGTYPAALNGANEEAVRLYLEGSIKFTSIVKLVKKILSKHKSVSRPSLEDVLSVNEWAKEEVRRSC